MKKLLGLVLTSFFLTGNPLLAQAADDKLEAIEKQLFSNSNAAHTEYRRCLTRGYNCAHSNEEYKEIEVHGPSIADTLAWIGDQLTERKLVHLYQFSGCKIAVDMTDGTPASLLWLEKKGDKLVKSHRSIFMPARDKAYKADYFSGNGYYIYLKKNHRDNGSAHSPIKLTYFNDAALIDLAKIEETKSKVVTDKKGNLVLRDKPSSAYRFNFFSTGADQVIGTQFHDMASIFTTGPSPFPNAGKTLDIFGNQYMPTISHKRFSQFSLILTPDDVEFALNIARAFRHAIELCELQNK